MFDLLTPFSIHFRETHIPDACLGRRHVISKIKTTEVCYTEDLLCIYSQTLANSKVWMQRREGGDIVSL